MIFVLLACRRGDFGEVRPDEPLPLFSEQGIWVINEGQFGFGNGEISFIDPLKSSISNNLFYSSNGIFPGDIPFDLYVDDSCLVLSVNNSGRLWILKRNDFTIQSDVKNITSPRFIVKTGQNRFAVSSFGNDSIYVIDLSGEVVQVNAVYSGKSTESMIVFGNILYATNWSAYGGNYDNTTVQMFHTQTNQYLGQIQTGKEPNSMVIDKNGSLWVLCSGGYMNEEKARLFRINTLSNTVEREFEFDDISMSPKSLTINPEGDRMYFLNGDVFSMSISDTILPVVPFFEAKDRNFYIVNASLYSDTIVVTDAGNYQVAGYVLFYNSTGILEAVYRAGIIPGNMRRNF